MGGFALICLTVGLRVTESVIPSAILSVRSSNGKGGSTGKKLFAAPAAFGLELPSESGRVRFSLVTPNGLQDGCEPELKPTFEAIKDTSINYALLVQRSPNCTFEQRALAAQKIGASAIIVQNTVEGIYHNRSHAEAQSDYECSYGKSYVSTLSSFGGKTAGFPDSTCALDESCASSRCVLTGSYNRQRGGYKVCCAWDMYMTMASVQPSSSSAASSASASDVSIPAVFITMQDSDVIYAKYPDLQTIEGRGGGASLMISGSPKAALYERYEPWVNWGSILIWALGVCTTAYASWSAGREVTKKQEARNRRMSSSTGQDTAEEKERVHPRISQTGHAIDGRMFMREEQSGDESNTEKNKDEIYFDIDSNNSIEEEAALELTLPHAFGFIVVASTVLLVLFYVDLYLFVTLLFCISAASSTATVLFRPFFCFVLGPTRSKRTMVSRLPCDLGPVSNADGLAFSSSIIVAVFWFIFRSSWPWAFIFQDIFGMCLCVIFLLVIRFSNIKVATLLLTMSFLYDIFFVFISPYFFKGESVMVKVATGNQPTKDPDFCEKYPDEVGCESSELPMLLLLPRIGDYAGGYTMLGLGDIVLPGLLVAFAARYDAARCVRPFGKRRPSESVHSSPSSTSLRNSNAITASEKHSQSVYQEQPPLHRHYSGNLLHEKETTSTFSERPEIRSSGSSYWLRLVAGYALGLAIANFAVYAMGMGQPALLYLVPCTLGILLLQARSDGVVEELWNGPPELKPGWSFNDPRGERSAVDSEETARREKSKPNQHIGFGGYSTNSFHDNGSRQDEQEEDTRLLGGDSVIDV